MMLIMIMMTSILLLPVLVSGLSLILVGKKAIYRYHDMISFYQNMTTDWRVRDYMIAIMCGLDRSRVLSITRLDDHFTVLELQVTCRPWLLFRRCDTSLIYDRTRIVIERAAAASSSSNNNNNNNSSNSDISSKPLIDYSCSQNST